MLDCLSAYKTEQNKTEAITLIQDEATALSQCTAPGETIPGEPLAPPLAPPAGEEVGGGK